MPNKVIIIKRIGETPLEALERFRRIQIEKTEELDLKIKWQSVPMTYAGRLDPMAEGELLILIGEECKSKERYLNLDKEYEVEVLFGVRTDTYDVLGLTNTITDVQPQLEDMQRYVGNFDQEYPPYSSRTVGGVALHELVRAGELPGQMPTKNIEIYSLDVLKTGSIDGNTIAKYAINIVEKIRGDFRQRSILSSWSDFCKKYGNKSFITMKIRVRCSSGTYMRSLANRIGRDVGSGACALSIKRTSIILHD